VLDTRHLHRSASPAP